MKERDVTKKACNKSRPGRRVRVWQPDSQKWLVAITIDGNGRVLVLHDPLWANAELTRDHYERIQAIEGDDNGG